MRVAINHSANSEQIIPLARKTGYLTMFEDGLVKIGQGITSLEEVLRVVV